jgi:hypothetical protein
MNGQFTNVAPVTSVSEVGLGEADSLSCAGEGETRH